MAPLWTRPSTIKAAALPSCGPGPSREAAAHQQERGPHPTLNGVILAKHHSSARNRKTEHSQFRTEPQNCVFTVPHGTAKLSTHSSVRNRKTEHSRFRMEPQN
ncbi:hypothetical protein DFH27DRAFT_529879 [Peziza echinospora]|nr:hypothetical protein DFH27DRAFT_529879 [Peziza echinospora]